MRICMQINLIHLIFSFFKQGIIQKKSIGGRLSFKFSFLEISDFNKGIFSLKETGVSIVTKQFSSLLVSVFSGEKKVTANARSLGTAQRKSQ